ncbi:MAG: hypothetical protein ACRESW_11220 [Nevskiales bacterium]
MYMLTQPDDTARKRRSLRLALLLAVLAVTFYGGFILMMGLR